MCSNLSNSSSTETYCYYIVHKKLYKSVVQFLLAKKMKTEGQFPVKREVICQVYSVGTVDDNALLALFLSHRLVVQVLLRCWRV
jgi:hypothetical protein